MPKTEQPRSAKKDGKNSGSGLAALAGYADDRVVSPTQEQRGSAANCDYKEEDIDPTGYQNKKPG